MPVHASTGEQGDLACRTRRRQRFKQRLLRCAVHQVAADHLLRGETRPDQQRAATRGADLEDDLWLERGNRPGQRDDLGALLQRVDREVTVTPEMIAQSTVSRDCAAAVVLL